MLTMPQIARRPFCGRCRDSRQRRGYCYRQKTLILDVCFIIQLFWAQGICDLLSPTTDISLIRRAIRIGCMFIAPFFRLIPISTYTITIDSVMNSNPVKDIKGTARELWMFSVYMELITSSNGLRTMTESLSIFMTQFKFMGTIK